MIVRILKTLQAKDNGKVQWFIENGIYDISDETLQSFIDMGVVDIELRETKVVMPEEPRQKRKYNRK